MHLNVTDPVSETLELLQSGCPVLFVNIAGVNTHLNISSHLAHDLADLASRRCIMHRIFNFLLDDMCEALRLVFD